MAIGSATSQIAILFPEYGLNRFFCHAVAVKELRKEVTRYRTLGELKDQLAVVSAPSLASDGVQS